MSRTYTWQGRCYERKYGNTKLVEVTLGDDKPLDQFVILLANRGAILSIGDSWVTDGMAGEEKYYSFEVIVVDSYKDNFFTILHDNGFKAI